jgi:DNA-binding transcriptional MerR regulator
MTLKLYKAADVCEIAQVQPYVLRSWEKEFPGIGVQKSDDSPRLYRQSDIDQVLRIKHLVFGEGLTLAGARRRLEGAILTPPPPAFVEAEDADEVLEVLGQDARTRIDHVRAGLRSLLKMLNGHGVIDPQESAPMPLGHSGLDYELTPPPAKVEPPARKPAISARRKATPVRKPAARGSNGSARRKTTTKRKRASA